MDIIPIEICLIITSFLDNASKRTMRLANTQWFNIIKYNCFNFYYTTENEFEEICRRLKTHQFPISVKFTNHKIVFNRQHYDMLGQLTHLNGLITGIPINTRSRHLRAFTNLTNLEVIDEFLPVAIIARLPNLKSIKMNTKEHIRVSKKLSKLESIFYDLDCEVTHTVSVDLQVLPNPCKLTKLVCDGARSEQSLDSLNNNLVKLSNLRELELRTKSWGEPDLVLPNSWNVPTLPNLERLAIHNLENIQTVSLANTKLTQIQLTGSTFDCSVFESLCNLRDLELRGKMTNLFALGSLTNLKKLELMFSSSRFRSDLALAEMWFLSKLSNLERFDIGSENGHGGLYESVQHFSENNKLTQICLNTFENRLDSNTTKFHKLETLVCFYLELESTNHMTVLTNLTNLFIFTLTPKTFKNIEKLTTLKVLHFSPGSSNDLPENKQFYFGKLQYLEHLTVRPQYGVDESSINHFEGLNELGRLTKLTIKWPVITESFFAKISQCKSLVEINCQSVDSEEAILPLGNMTNLKRLYLITSSNCRGVNLTCLTSLQLLHIYPPYSPFFGSKILKPELPNLRFFNLRQ